MNIGIYNPYFNTLGGGERYVCSIASCLKNGNTVRIFWDDPTILAKAQERFNIDLKGVSVVKNIWKKSSVLEKNIQSSNLDILFIVSDGSIPLSLAKKTYLIFQFPVKDVHYATIWAKMKLGKINKILCYSSFVKEHLEKELKSKALVIPPAIDTSLFTEKIKKNIIISVGRFTKGNNTKKQEILIKAFKHMFSQGFTGWELILAGGMLEGDTDIIENLTDKSRGLPISIKPNIDLKELTEIYASAKIYWHAAGYGENLDVHPEYAEHFGITTLESMSAGCVPVVFNGGGQKEIVHNGKDGYLWDTIEALEEKTYKIAHDASLFSKLSREAKETAAAYGKDAFCTRISNLMSV